MDFKSLLSRVDEGYRTWRVPSLVMHGSKDPFISIREVFDWLESKRTTMRMQQLEGAAVRIILSIRPSH